MAMVKPISHHMNAFDATQEQIFYFESTGGNQVVANKLTIRLQSDNSIVYENKVESYLFRQILPANTLVNDEYYSFYFNTYDINGEESESSIAVQFYCYSNPSLILGNLPLNNLVESSGYTFTATYSQQEGELIDYVKFCLYDQFDNLVNESELYYGTGQIPITFSHTFNGFENNGTYKIQVVGKTLNGMEVSTIIYTFMSRYFYPQMYSLLDLENECNSGSVRIESNVVIVDGEVSEKFDPPIYIDSLDVDDPDIYVKWEENFTYDMNNYEPISKWLSPSYIDVHNYDNYVRWTEGFTVKTDFTLRLFMKMGRIGTIATIGTEQNGYIIKFVRDIPFGETTVKDYMVLEGYSNGVLKVKQKSNYVELMNGQSYYMVWIRKIGNIYDVKLTVIEQGVGDILEWDIGNIDYEKTTTIIWGDSDYHRAEQFIPKAENMDNIFPLTSVNLTNGIYDHINITSDVATDFSTIIPKWDYKTRLDCDFNGNVQGGNTLILLSTLRYVRIKRRKKGTFNWITLKQYEINSIEDLSIILNDYFVPSGYDADYALVPVLDGDIEGDYICNSIKTKFNTVTIADKHNAYTLKAQVTYGGDVKNAPVGTYLPLLGKYPIIQKNSELNYYTGSLTATLLGYNYEKGKYLDRNDMVKQKNDICDFLNDMNAKVLKDWNGNIWIVRFGSPNISYNGDYGNGIPTLTATWTEQGEFDNQNDLYINGLIDVFE